MSRITDFVQLIKNHAQDQLEQLATTPPPLEPKRDDPSFTRAWTAYNWARKDHANLMARVANSTAVVTCDAVIGHPATDAERVAFGKALKRGDSLGLWSIEKYGRTRAVRLLGQEAEQ